MKKAGIIMRTHNEAIIVAAVTIVCLAPFANKAFHIDDPLFIWAAKQIQTNPLDFYGFSVNWYGQVEPMSEVTQNPPITCYYIALIASMFGWSEIAMHIAFLVPAVAMALGTYYLAERLCSRPALAALAAVLTPGFLVSSTNIMCDTMMLAFWVWAIFLWMHGIETNKHWSLFFAAMLAAICALTKYFGMALLALLFVYSIMRKRKLGAWVLFLLLSAVILAGYQWFTRNLYGHGLLSNAAAYATEQSSVISSKLPLKTLTGLCFTGGCIITAMFYSPLLWSRRALISSVILTVLFILILSMIEKIDKVSIRDADNTNWGFLIQAGLMAAGGVNILWLAGADFRKYRNAESLLLLLWVLGTFIFASFINWTINARSILPMSGAVGILIMRRIDDRYNKKNSRQTAIWGAVLPLIAAAIVSLLVCRTDYLWADTAHQAAAKISKTLETAGRTIWFQGHWGFQYYMEAAGGKAIDFKKSQITHEDIIIIPSHNANINPPLANTMQLLDTIQFAPRSVLATMDIKLGAGFYTNLGGPLPFSFGEDDTEKYYVFVTK